MDTEKFIEIVIAVFSVPFFIWIGAIIEREFGSFENAALWMTKLIFAPPAPGTCRKCGHIHAESAACVFPRHRRRR